MFALYTCQYSLMKTVNYSKFCVPRWRALRSLFVSLSTGDEPAFHRSKCPRLLLLDIQSAELSFHWPLLSVARNSRQRKTAS